jgi:phospholipid transport system substrate-binding protein
MTGNIRMLSRRKGLLALGGMAAVAASAVPEIARAQAEPRPAVGGAPVGPIETFDQALISAMRTGNAPFAQRYAALLPVVEQVFALDDILARSVGFSWASMPADQKAALGAAFRRYTVSSYLVNFDSYNGQRFEVLGTRPAGDGQTVVRTSLVRSDGSTVELDYVMGQGARGWQVVDVLMNGTISRVAVQRSDFRYLLSRGGTPALTASLQQKVATLSGGMQG